MIAGALILNRRHKRKKLKANSKAIVFAVVAGIVTMAPAAFYPTSTTAIAIFIVGFQILGVTLVYDLGRDLVLFNAVGLANGLLFSFVVILEVVITGRLFAKYGSGESCTLIATDGKFEYGLYLRSLGNGHLFRIDGKTVFIPKEKVFRITCKSLPGSMAAEPDAP
jgi:hypothetical protein